MSPRPLYSSSLGGGHPTFVSSALSLGGHRATSPTLDEFGNSTQQIIADLVSACQVTISLGAMLVAVMAAVAVATALYRCDWQKWLAWWATFPPSVSSSRRLSPRERQQRTWVQSTDTTQATATPSMRSMSPKHLSTSPPPPSPPQQHGVRHIAFIMDGNRRFGVSRFRDALRGHSCGGEKLLEVVRWCLTADIGALTVFAFSSENWSRSRLEVDTLMALFSDYFERIRRDAAGLGIRIRFISTEPEKIPASVYQLMRAVESETRGYGAIVVNVCVGYGSRQAIVLAAQRLQSSQQPADCGTITEAALRYELSRSITEVWPDGVTQATLPPIASASCCSQTESAAQPRDAAGAWYRSDPDMVVRTSGEVRVSNFLLFELAYSELFFVGATWPSLSWGQFCALLVEFRDVRKRRFGA